MVIVFLVVSILIGLIAGAGARWIMPGPDPLGQIGSAALGAAGALVGYAAAAPFGLASPVDSPVPSIFLAILGALGVLILYRCYAMRAAE
jgi:uncharacterized membrane protein YeaQ/YmgE (transglycosylase-associated protein family)